MATPERLCVGCRTRFPRERLVRFVADERGHLAVDPAGRHQGRGVYCCPQVKCLTRAAGREALSRSLRRRLSPLTAEDLSRAVLDGVRREAGRLRAAGSQGGRRQALLQEQWERLEAELERNAGDGGWK
jgi:predicted RNA-binding protein YlxR (DUF448 family)